MNTDSLCVCTRCGSLLSAHCSLKGFTRTVSWCTACTPDRETRRPAKVVDESYRASQLREADRLAAINVEIQERIAAVEDVFAKKTKE